MPETAVIHLRDRPTAGDKGQWLCVRSSSLSRFVALEILAESDSLKLTSELQDVLRQISVGQPLQGKVTLLPIWVETDGLNWIVRNKDDQEQRTLAVRLCVMHRAHYPLMKKLFNISRQELAELRKEFAADVPPTKPKSIGTGQLNAIYQCWRELCLSYERETDRWVMLASRFPSYALSSLYTVICVESATPVGQPATDYSTIVIGDLND